jgi:hypothetical protein
VNPAPSSFTFEPLFLALTVVAGVLYFRAARMERPPAWRIVLFSLGLLLIAGALNSPLETIAANYLLLFHLLQNVMIADWAPPLLILGLTPAMRASVARQAGSPSPRSRAPRRAPGLARRVVCDPPRALLRLRAAARVDAQHRARTPDRDRLPLLVAGARRPAGDIGAPVKIGYLGAAFVGSTFLGLGLTFASTPFYDFYARRRASGASRQRRTRTSAASS